MRCKYCNTLIIHRFDGNYNGWDKKRKMIHERMCNHNPNVMKRKIKTAELKARLFSKYLNEVAD